MHIPSALRKWTGGHEVIELPLQSGMQMTAVEVIESLAREHPGIRDRVLTEQGELRRHVNIFIDGENTRFIGGLSAQVGAESEMWIHPSLSGGAPGVALVPLNAAENAGRARGQLSIPASTERPVSVHSRSITNWRKQ
ncbi:MAG: hypothetical protein ACREQB_10595 [Candidatus Binataceae bacterium]